MTPTRGLSAGGVRRAVSHILWACLVCCICSAHLRAQSLEWRLRCPSPPYHSPIAYDSAREVTVRLSDGHTWEWDGDSWTLQSINGPSAGWGSVMAYDSARLVTVLFDSAVGETWEWDSTEWTLRSTAGPSSDANPASAYDSARSVIVLFDGYARETWEWDGTSWALRSSAGPSARHGHAMAYDSDRAVTVLMGGRRPDATCVFDTWEWNGNAWLLRSTTGPRPFPGHAMAYDSCRHVTVLYSGYEERTWEWDGTYWLERPLALPFYRYAYYTMAYDTARAATVLFGGCGIHNFDFADTFEFDGISWTKREGYSNPASRRAHAMTYHSGRDATVLFGGEVDDGVYDNKVWQWDGRSWALWSALGPSPRGHAAMAYDSARGVIVLFGGFDGSGVNNETWECDGETWTLRSTSGPPARCAHALVYDPTRGVTVLYGGESGSPDSWGGPFFADTWEWDGYAWVERSVSGPGALAEHIMVYDNLRQVVVLFGGLKAGSACANNGVWEWNGVSWTLRALAEGLPNYGIAATYDWRRGKVVLAGYFEVRPEQEPGYCGIHGGMASETWEWNGDEWIASASNISGGARSYHPLAMVYDGKRGVSVAFQGGRGTTWEYSDFETAEDEDQPEDGEDPGGVEVDLEHLWVWSDEAGRFVEPEGSITVDPDQPTYLLTHGWDGALDGGTCGNMAQEATCEDLWDPSDDPAFAMSSVASAIRRARPEANILGWDWSDAADPDGNCTTGESIQLFAEALSACMRHPDPFWCSSQVALCSVFGGSAFLRDAYRSGLRTKEEGNKLGEALAGLGPLGSELHLIGKSHGGGVLGQAAQSMNSWGQPANTLTTLDTPNVFGIINSLKRVDPESLADHAAVFYYPLFDLDEGLEHLYFVGGFGAPRRSSNQKLTNIQLNGAHADGIAHLWIAGNDDCECEPFDGWPGWSFDDCPPDDGWYPLSVWDTDFGGPQSVSFDGAPLESILSVFQFPSGNFVERERYIFVPMGACYTLGPVLCTETDEETCAELGGTYQGDHTDCLLFLSLPAGVDESRDSDVLDADTLAMVRVLDEPFESAASWFGTGALVVTGADPDDPDNRVILMFEDEETSFFKDIDWPERGLLMTFDYMFREPRGDESLTVYINGEVAYYDGASTSLATEALTSSGALYVGNPAGTTARLTFLLRTDGESGGQLVLDNVRVSAIAGDFDGDADVDLDDYAFLPEGGNGFSCLTGPGGDPIAQECEPGDFDDDGDIDLWDFAAFQSIFYIPCGANGDCDDDAFCNGEETCIAGVCINGSSPCNEGEICDELLDECRACTSDDECDDGLFCSGQEECDSGTCVDGILPCGEEEACDEENDTCIPVIQVDAGPDQDVIACEQVTLSASASAPGLPQSQITIVWSGDTNQVDDFVDNGDGTATFIVPADPAEAALTFVATATTALPGFADGTDDVVVMRSAASLTTLDAAKTSGAAQPGDTVTLLFAEPVPDEWQEGWSATWTADPGNVEAVTLIPGLNGREASFTAPAVSQTIELTFDALVCTLDINQPLVTTSATVSIQVVSQLMFDLPDTITLNVPLDLTLYTTVTGAPPGYVALYFVEDPPPDGITAEIDQDTGTLTVVGGVGETITVNVQIWGTADLLAEASDTIQIVAPKRGYVGNEETPRSTRLAKPALAPSAGVSLNGGLPWDFEYTANGGVIADDAVQWFPLYVPVGLDVFYIELEIAGLTHTAPMDLNVFVLDPAGGGIEVVADRGGQLDVVDLTIVFSDEGVALPEDTPLEEGPYLPSGPGTFSQYYFDNFGTLTPGTWYLVVIDDCFRDSGSFESFMLRGHVVTRQGE
jgi:hypothetical protein